MRPTLRRTIKRLQSFRRAQDGVAALEFALIALPFFALLFAILEVALLFMVSTTLENSMGTSARTIRTGELQTGNAARPQPKTNAELAGEFKSQICGNLGWLQAQCGNALFVDVRTYTQFSQTGSATDPVRVSGGRSQFDPTQTTFVPGGPRDIVLVRAFYRWPIVSPLLTPAMVEMGDNEHVVTAVSVFRNEPYED